MEELCIVKVGGNILDDSRKMKIFLQDLCGIRKNMVLVHGGGKWATALAEKLGISTQMVDGRRITNAEMLKVTTMVYAGWINKNIVATLNAKNKKALGMCGADLSILISKKRKKGKVDYGFVGDVILQKTGRKILSELIDQGIFPVIAPITTTEKGQLLNTNADTIAAVLATALSNKYKTRLIYCFEKKGVINGEKVISKINPKIYSELLKNRMVNGGMIPKLENAFQALDSGVKEVIIGDATQIKKLIRSHGGSSITK